MIKKLRIQFVSIIMALLTLLFGCTGVRGKILNHLTDEEVGKLRHSADCLRAVIDDVEI